MKTIVTLLLLVSSNIGLCQYLSLDTLLKLQKSSDFSIEKILTSKNWSLDNTKDLTEASTWGGDDGIIQLKQMSYAYNRNSYNSKSQLWVSVIRRAEEDIDSNNSEPKCRIYYQLHSTVDYSKILSRATALGFKPYKSWTTDDDEFIKVLVNDRLNVALHVLSKKTTDETGKNINIYEITVISRADYMLNYSE